jgi:hypothetical protein
MTPPKCRICGIREHNHHCQGGTPAMRIEERARVRAREAQEPTEFMEDRQASSSSRELSPDPRLAAAGPPPKRASAKQVSPEEGGPGWWHDPEVHASKEAPSPKARWHDEPTPATPEEYERVTRPSPPPSVGNVGNSRQRWHEDTDSAGEPQEVRDPTRRPARFYAPPGSCAYCDRRREAARHQMAHYRERGER